MMSARTLFRSESGSVVTEFALIAPVLMLTLFGMFDFGQAMYTQSLLQGAIDKAARASTIEGSTTTDLDDKVAKIVRQIAPGATVDFKRTAYANFTNVVQPEDYDDANNNGTCDKKEPFEDANGNGIWDIDRGRSGKGGARDAIVYKVTVEYPRLFPIGKLIGQSNKSKMVAVSVLRNQPFGLQEAATVIGAC
jgi:hypothetical protein